MKGRKRKEVVSDLDVTQKDKFYYQQCNGCDSVDESIVGLLVICGTMSDDKTSTGSCDEKVNECLDYASISTAMTESTTEDSSVGDNFDNLNHSDLEIEILMRQSDSVIEEFVASTSHVKDENKIGAECLMKF